MKKNSKARRDLSQAAATTAIVSALLLLEHHISGNLHNLSFYVVEIITLFFVFYLINHYRNQTKEEADAENTAVADSIKKQMEPFVGKVDDMNHIESEESNK